jgi:hypothetical protein
MFSQARRTCGIAVASGLIGLIGSEAAAGSFAPNIAVRASDQNLTRSLNPDVGRRPTVTSPPGPESITRSRHHSFKPDPPLKGATAATTRDRAADGPNQTPHF